MQQFQRAMVLFSDLAEQVTIWERTLPPGEAQKKTGALFRDLSDTEFEMIVDLLDLVETEPGKRLFAINTVGFRQHLLEIRLARETAQSANAGKPLTDTERREERQK